MKKYIGIKVIKAEPMTIKEAQKVLGRKIATLKPVTVEENGYLVEYKDGYKSWSPKDVFEESYREVGSVDFGGAIDLLMKALKYLEDNMEQNNKQTMPDFELGNLYVFNEEDEDGELTIIGKLIAKNESQDTLTFGNQYEIETEKFVTDQAFDMRISVQKELREATEDEASLFQEAYTLWKKNKERLSFRTFDKVLVRNLDELKWRPAIFVQTRIGDHSPYMYNALLLPTGQVGDFVQCIKYEGNEKMAFTTAPF